MLHCTRPTGSPPAAMLICFTSASQMWDDGSLDQVGEDLLLLKFHVFSTTMSTVCVSGTFTPQVIQGQSHNLWE